MLVGLVASYCQSDLMSKAFNLNINDYMTLYKAICNESLFTLWQYLECHIDVLHFFSYDISPHSFTIFLIQDISLLHHLGEFDTMFMDLFKYLACHFLISAIILYLFLIICPTLESLLIVNSLGHSIFGYLNGM